MDALVTAINARLKAQLGYSAHFTEAPEGTALPYLVLTIVSEVPSYTFTSTNERTVIQFDMYSASKTDALSRAKALKAAMDDCVLAVTGYRFGKFERELSQPLKDGDAWRVIVQYAAELQKI
jgi:hypothetical protein